MSNLLLNQNSNFLLLLAAFMQQQQQQQQQQQNQIQAQQRDHSIRLLESLFAINPEPGEEAIELIAQRVESSAHEVANWFHLRREQALSDRQAAAELERINPSLLASLADHLANRLPACSSGQQSSRASNGNGSPLRPEASRITPAAAAAAATARALAMAAQQHQQQSQFNQNSTNASFTSPNSTLNQIQQYEELLAINNNNNNTPSAMLNHRLDHTNYLLAQHNLRAHSPPSSATSPHPNLMGYSNTSAHEHTMSNGSLQNGSLNNNNFTVTNNNTNACPSSTLLSKLNAVTSRQGAHLLTSELDPNMIDLLEALYAINDNPEPSAIEMISKRVSVTVDAISDWFDKKRLKLNPYAGPRSPPANKKREGGRVVTFSEYQRSLLEAIFNENNYLHPQEYEELSKLIQVPSRNIKIWFKNRRSKQRLSRPPGSGDVTGGSGAALSRTDLNAGAAAGGEGLLGQGEADDDLGLEVESDRT